MDYAEMMRGLKTAGNASPTSDGVAALAAFKPAKSGLHTEVPEHLRNKTVPITAETLKMLMASLAPVVAAHVEQQIADAVAPLAQRIAALEHELEQRAVPRWRGVFVQGAQYHQLEFTVCAGALWICKTDTDTRPGSSDHWQLCCKSKPQ